MDAGKVCSFILITGHFLLTWKVRVDVVFSYYWYVFIFQVVEFDTPLTLMSNRESVFHGMLEAAGVAMVPSTASDLSPDSPSRWCLQWAFKNSYNWIVKCFFNQKCYALSVFQFLFWNLQSKEPLNMLSPLSQCISRFCLLNWLSSANCCLKCLLDITNPWIYLIQGEITGLKTLHFFLKICGAWGLWKKESPFSSWWAEYIEALNKYLGESHNGVSFFN